MKICSIEARNFRTLENISLDFNHNYCAISGKNNAGKTAVVKLIRLFLENKDDDRLYMYNDRVSFARDSTQWASTAAQIEVKVQLQLDRIDDSEVFFFVETFAAQKIPKDVVNITLVQVIGRDDRNTVSCYIEGVMLDERASSEILKKIRSVSSLVVHNSTAPSRSYFYRGSSLAEFLEASFSPDDRKRIEDAENNLRTKVKKAAKSHKEELEKLLGKLSDKYHVELGTIDNGRSSRFPLEIKLTDKSVEVPLGDWGAGTQNRTKVLMSVLDAVRTRSSVNEKDRSTPIFLVEEPESFLHPSAQAEFGQVLNGLAEELKIQIIATTHSPYMLNQKDPTANILLERRIYRGLPRETTIRDTSGDDWMLPFAENLGIIPAEFEHWKKVFGVNSNRVVLVEGEIDKKYFEIFKAKYPALYSIPDDVEVVAYGGKDALKNTTILQFMISKFGRVFVTFDLDARSEVKASLDRIGLVEGADYCAIGRPVSGCECIEGLLPAEIMRNVYGSRYDLVTAATSQDTKVRNSARSQIKQELLSEFERHDRSEKDLSDFKKMFGSIATAFTC